MYSSVARVLRCQRKDAGSSPATCFYKRRKEMKKQYKVVKALEDTELKDKWPNGMLRDMLGFDVFTFPKVGTILETSDNGHYVKYGEFALCDVGSNMCKLCLEPI